MKKRGYKILLAVLILALLVLNYNFLDRKLEGFVTSGQTKNVFVTRVIDGDTITFESESGEGIVRLLGINAPERKEFLYEESKNFLEELLLNKSIVLEFVGPRTDKYGRTLAYIFLDGRNINIEMVRNGFANYYFYDGRDKYSDELEEAWNECLTRGVNLCTPSRNEYASCVKIIEDAIVNECSFVCDVDGWTIKGEGRAKFVFEGTLGVGEEKEFYLDLSNSGRSLFLRDEVGGLVFYLS